MVMHSLIFSQGLTPKIQTFDKDTLFCFSIPQSKLLAEYVLKSEYSDSIILHLERQNKLFDSLLIGRENQAELLNKRIGNLELVSTKREQQIALLKRNLHIERKKLKRHRLITISLGLGVVVLMGITLIN